MIKVAYKYYHSFTVFKLHEESGYVSAVVDKVTIAGSLRNQNKTNCLRLTAGHISI